MRRRLMQSSTISPAAFSGLRGVLWITVALVLAACSTPPSEPRQRERRQAGTPADSERSTAEMLASFNELLERSETSRLTFGSGARDPFVNPIVAAADIVSRDHLGVDCNPETDPLGMIRSVESLTLAGLVTGVATPRAMFHHENRDYVVTEGARLGPRCSWRISEIRNNEIVLEPVGLEEGEWRTRILTWPVLEPEAEVEDADDNGDDGDAG